MVRRKTTIGDNPLDAVVPDRVAAGKTHQAKPHVARPQPAPVAPERVVKERLTVHLPVILIDRLKNAVYWTPGLTLAGLAEDALERAMDRMEKARGEPFEPRKGRIKAGRPPK
jgi:hypothetical protein